jgi:hypothetical protein
MKARSLENIPMHVLPPAYPPNLRVGHASSRGRLTPWRAGPRVETTSVRVRVLPQQGPDRHAHRSHLRRS